MARTIAEDVADYLIARGLATTKGDDIRQDIFPDEQPSGGLAILLARGGGSAAQRTLDSGRILNPGFAISVRANPNLYNEGQALAEAIYDAMLDLTNISVEGRRYIGANPLTDISYLGRDESDRHKWTMSFIVKTS